MAPITLNLSEILKEDENIEQTTLKIETEEPRMSGMMALAMRRKTIILEKSLEPAQVVLANLNATRTLNGTEQ